MEIPPESPAIRSQGRPTLGDERETRLGEDYSEVSTHAQEWRSIQLEYYQLERLHLSAHRWEHLSVLLYLEPVDSLLFQVRDRWEACEVRPGHFSIHPQGSIDRRLHYKSLETGSHIYIFACYGSQAHARRLGRNSAT